MADIWYGFASSAVRVRAKVVTTTDEYADPQTSVAVEDVEVELINRAVALTECIRVGGRRGNTDFKVNLTPDGRLESIDYKATGIGSAVVTAGAKLLALVASIARAVVGAAAAGDAGTRQAKKPSAREQWKTDRADQALQLEKNQALAAEASLKLLDVRRQIVREDGLTKVKNLLVREQALVTMWNAAVAEIARLEDLYRLWAESKRASSTATVEYLLDLEDVPRRVGDQDPDLTKLSGKAGDLWESVGVLIQVADGAGAPISSTSNDADPEPTSNVRWRISRSVELLVWKRADDGAATLVNRSPARIVDGRSELRQMELKSSIFGEHGGTWTFNADGSPAAISLQSESGVGAFANALSGVPAALVESAEQGKKLVDAWHGIADAGAEREKAAAERELAAAKARLELVGLHATREDFAALQRAEQGVKLRTANRALSFESEALESLKRQLELANTEVSLQSQRRTALIEMDLAELKSELARVEVEAKLAKAAHDRDNPGSAEAGN
jgi:hypothetical protein